VGGTDARVDAYIAGAPAFARPILEHLRACVHAGCPAVEESIKWGAPHFLAAGRLLCNMNAFKAHVGFGFWLGERVVGDDADASARGQFGRITALADLPPRRELVALVRKAAALAADGAIRAPRKPAASKPAARVPDDLAAALGRDRAARATFERFSASHRREYIEWIEDAKREDTRARRLATTVEWLAEGKPRHWKYGAR
jgi:uncharacterized protein YdeI (YjbR/CyaY-like superfamily)